MKRPEHFYTLESKKFYYAEEADDIFDELEAEIISLKKQLIDKDIALQNGKLFKVTETEREKLLTMKELGDL